MLQPMNIASIMFLSREVEVRFLFLTTNGGKEKNTDRSVSFLASAESYVFRSFLKTIVLVITLGALHGLVFLPVLLTLFYSSDTNNKRRQIYAISRPPQTDPRCGASIDTRPFSNIGKADIYAQGNDFSGGGPTTAQLVYTKRECGQYATPRKWKFLLKFQLGFNKNISLWFQFDFSNFKHTEKENFYDDFISSKL
uniref:Uncharacterized protein n=1 Tax=Parascaris equorum TaxID=6256 RepID=A0A914RHD2_PAREQ